MISSHNLYTGKRKRYATHLEHALVSYLFFFWPPVDLCKTVAPFLGYEKKNGPPRVIINSFLDVAPTYVYKFQHRMSVSMYPDWVHADHAMEMFFVLGDIYANRIPMVTDQDKLLSKQLMTFWTNFAKNG